MVQVPSSKSIKYNQKRIGMRATKKTHTHTHTSSVREGKMVKAKRVHCTLHTIDLAILRWEKNCDVVDDIHSYSFRPPPAFAFSLSLSSRVSSFFRCCYCCCCCWCAINSGHIHFSIRLSNDFEHHN